MTDRLNFLIKKDLWLATEEEPFKVLGWTTIKPKFDNGYIKKNTVLIFSHMFEDAINFVMIPAGLQYMKWFAEFLQKEIESLTNEGTLELIKINEIVEAAIAPGFPELTQGPILIRESTLFEFTKEAILPKDLYIVMGPRENRQSQGNIVTGEKISLRHLLDVYSTAVGQNLISK
jgi:hypothetical protein